MPTSRPASGTAEAVGGPFIAFGGALNRHAEAHLALLHGMNAALDEPG